MYRSHYSLVIHKKQGIATDIATAAYSHQTTINFNVILNYKF